MKRLFTYPKAEYPILFDIIVASILVIHNISTKWITPLRNRLDILVLDWNKNDDDDSLLIGLYVFGAWW